MDINYLEYNRPFYSNKYSDYLNIGGFSIFSKSSSSISINQLYNTNMNIKNIKDLNFIENFSIKDDYLKINNYLLDHNSSILINMSISNKELLMETNYLQIIFSNIFYLLIIFYIFKTIKIFKALIYIITLLICVIGNVMVILSVFTYKPLQSVQNIFIVSLALADTFVAVFVMPFQISLVIYNKWVFGLYACHFFLTLDILLCTASILHLCCIALDRYWAIKDSIRYAQKRTMKRVLIMILIAWLLSAVISLPVIIWNSIGKKKPIFNNATIVTQDQNESYGCEIPDDQIYRLYSSFGTFFGPLVIMTWVYMRIYLETKRRLHERAKAATKLAKSIEKSAIKDYSSIKKQKRTIKDLIFLNKKKQPRNFCFKLFYETDYSIDNKTFKKNSIENLDKNNNLVDYKTINSNDRKRMDNSKCMLSADYANFESTANTKKIKIKYEKNKTSNSLKNNDYEMSSCSHSYSSEKVTTPKKEIISVLENKKFDVKTQLDEILIEGNKKSFKMGKKFDDSCIIDKNDLTYNKDFSNKNHRNSKKYSTSSIILENSFDKTKLEANKHIQGMSVIAKANPISIWQQSSNTGIALKQRQKISLTRERKAARTLGIIMGAFCACWLPFFIVYLLQSIQFIKQNKKLMENLDSISQYLTMLGYVNSALNPLIYTIFNLDFRKSFERILCKLCLNRILLCKRNDFYL